MFQMISSKQSALQSRDLLFPKTGYIHHSKSTDDKFFSLLKRLMIFAIFSSLGSVSSAENARFIEYGFEKIAPNSWSYKHSPYTFVISGECESVRGCEIDVYAVSVTHERQRIFQSAASQRYITQNEVQLEPELFVAVCIRVFATKRRYALKMCRLKFGMMTSFWKTFFVEWNRVTLLE
ncbi:MAG: hypothetical protein ACWA40_00250 [Planktomarina sp.]